MNDTTKFFNEIDRLIYKGGHNVRIYAQRAMDLVTASFAKNDKTGEFERRENADAAKVEIVNKLVKMGAIEAIYGRGRTYLH